MSVGFGDHALNVIQGLCVKAILSILFFVFVNPSMLMKHFAVNGH